MSGPFYYLTLDTDGSTVKGYSWYGDEPAKVPAGQIACTLEQANAWKLYKVVDGAIVSNLFGAQGTQIATLRAAAKAAIVAGFTSSALGAANTYPSDSDTQSNIGFATVAGGNIHCCPAGGTWSFTAHTAAQANLVQTDLWTHIQVQQTLLVNLTNQVNAATTLAAVQAAAWPTTPTT